MSLKDELHNAFSKTPGESEWHRQPEILLSFGVPPPLHGVSPRTVLGDEWWRCTRYESYRSTNYHCIACGISKYSTVDQVLDGHEVYEIDFLLGRMEYVKTVPLCRLCHSFIHLGRIKMLLEQMKVTKADFEHVVQHGLTVLKDAGLLRPEQPRTMADWNEWRLVVDGKEYPPKYASAEAWLKGYSEDLSK